MPPLGYKRVNTDGSRNVWCPQCRRYICTASAMSAINTAICVLCQAGNDGIDLTEEQIKELTGVRVGEYTVSQTAAYPEQGTDPITGKNPTDADQQVGRIGYFFKALVTAVARAGVETIKDALPESVKVARANKRRRAFELPIDDYCSGPGNAHISGTRRECMQCRIYLENVKGMTPEEVEEQLNKINK